MGTVKKVSYKAREFFKKMVSDTIRISPKPFIVDPIPILDDNGETISWMIGVQSGSLLCGFLQLDENLQYMRYASFQRDTSSMKGCPSADSWLNVDIIKEKTQQFADNITILGDPYLSYDGNLTRLCWIVPVEDLKGKQYEIRLAGDYIYTK